MKIVYVIPKLKKTGVVNVMLNMISKLSDQDIMDIFVVVLDASYMDSELIKYLEDKDVAIYRVNNGSYYKLGTVNKLQSIIDNIKPNVVHSHSLVADFFCRNLKRSETQLVSTVHTDAENEFLASYIKPVANLLVRLQIMSLKKFDRVFAVSNAVASYLNKYDVPSTVIWNGVSDVKVNAVNLIGGKMKCVIAANLTGNKNLEPLLDFFAVKPEYDFYLLGDGPLKDKFTAEYPQNNIHFLGRVSNVREYLAACDIYVSASVSEGLSMSTIEAMSQNIALVLSDIPGHRDLRQEDTAYIQFFNLNNVSNTIQSAINKIEANNIEYCDTRLTYLKYFTDKVMATAYLDEYNAERGEMDVKV